MDHFGAVYGRGYGLMGQSFAIPTVGVDLYEIRRYVNEFIRFADRYPEMTFFVTRIGCGIAGFTDGQIAPLFAAAYSLPNVYLPREFWEVLSCK